MQHLNTSDQLYIDSLRDTLENGVVKHDRTGVGTTSVFGRMQTFDLYGYKMPIPSFRKNFPRSWIHETIWFISGSTDIKYLKDNNVSIWDSWVSPETAVYRDLSQDEIKLAITKQQKAEGFADVVYAMYDHVDHTATDTWALEAVAGDGGDEPFPSSHTREIYYSGDEDLKSLYVSLFDAPPRKLVSGSIGQGAYGYQWRQLEDTRLIDKGVDLTPYLERGFSHEGDLAETQVITRKIDQLQGMIDLLRTNPDSRRIIMVAYNPTMTDKQDAILPPCHSLVQCWTRELDWTERMDWAVEFGPLERESSIEITAEELDDLGVPRRALQLLLYLRSNDEPAGRQSNIPQYAMLAHMLAQCAGMVAEKLIIMNGDLHIYSNQHDAVNEMLERDSHPDSNPTIRLNPDIREIDDFTFDDIEIVDYHHQPHIHVPIAV